MKKNSANCYPPKGFSDEKGMPNYWLDAVEEFWKESGLQIDCGDLGEIINFFDQKRENYQIKYTKKNHPFLGWFEKKHHKKVIKIFEDNLGDIQKINFFCKNNTEEIQWEPPSCTNGIYVDKKQNKTNFHFFRIRELVYKYPKLVKSYASLFTKIVL